MRASMVPAHVALGLSSNPFPSTPDATRYFHTPHLEMELVEAAHCILSHKGFVLLTGEIGRGKSTFVRRLMDQLEAHRCIIAMILNTFLHGADLLDAINRDLGLEPARGMSESLERLNLFLLEKHRAGETVAIVVDDAHNLSMESLELLRMLSNIETDQEKLVQIVLVGQPELLDKLRSPSIRQLASRIVKHIQIDDFDRTQTGRYVEFRLTASGADGRLRLTSDGLRVLFRHCGGNPRRIHLIMDRALYGVLASRRPDMDGQLIELAVKEAGMISGAPPAKRSLTAWFRLAAWPVTALSVIAAAFMLWSPLSSAWLSVLNPVIAPITSAAVPVADASPEAVNARVAPFVPVADASVTPEPAPPAEASALHEAPEQAWVACLRGIGVEPGASAPLAESSFLPDWLKQGVSSADERLRLTQLPADMAQPHLDKSMGCALSMRQGTWIVWRAQMPEGLVEYGSKGDAVMWLQRQLIDAGIAGVMADGIFGPRTALGLAHFQRDRQLPVTGSADDLTLLFLQSGARSAPQDG